jgi:hypothetical protein
MLFKKRLQDKSRKLADDEKYDVEIASKELVKSNKKGFGLLGRLRTAKANKELQASVLGMG